MRLAVRRFVSIAKATTLEIINEPLSLLLLSASLVLQAMRMGMISTMLKEKRTWLYGLFISACGVANIAACIFAAHAFDEACIPLFTLSGDLLLTLVLAAYFLKNRRFSL